MTEPNSSPAASDTSASNGAANNVANNAGNSIGASHASAADPFAPAKLGPITLRNRIIKSATFEGVMPEALVTPELIEYHRVVAAGGVGMTTVAYLAVSPEGRTHAECLWMREEAIPGLTKLTEAIHAEGAAISGQIGHGGVVANSKSNQLPSIAPSKQFNPIAMRRVHEATEADISRVLGDFAKAARIAVTSGFDCLEIHLGHNYLPSSFLSPRLNKREDSWGGSLENRAKFAREAVKSVRAEVNNEIAVIAKLNMKDAIPGGLELEESLEVAKMLEADGGLDALELTGGSSYGNPMYLFRGEAPLKEFAQTLPVIPRLAFKLMGKKMMPAYPFKEAFFREHARKYLAELNRPAAHLAGRHQRARYHQVGSGRRLRLCGHGAGLAAHPRPDCPHASRRDGQRHLHPLQQVHAHHLQRHSLRAGQPRAHHGRRAGGVAAGRAGLDWVGAGDQGGAVGGVAVALRSAESRQQPLSYCELGDAAQFPVAVLNLVGGAGPKQSRSLEQGFAALGIATILDLLTFYPLRYIDRRNFASIAGLASQVPSGAASPEEFVVLGEITSVEAQHRLGGKRGGWQKGGQRKARCNVTVTDGTGNLDCVFFNQPWRANQFEVGMEVYLSGKVKRYGRKLSMANPMVDLIGDKVGQIVPVYPQSGQAKQHWLDSGKVRDGVAEALRRAAPRGFADPVPTEIRRRLRLASRDEALRGIHFPEDFAEQVRARERLVFDELFRSQVWLFQRKISRQRAEGGIAHQPADEFLGVWRESLPFELTSAQSQAIADISCDMAKPWPMQRLLQGDVGSGKTAVSMAAMLIAVCGGHQAAIMAPTEVLAEQIFFTTRTYLEKSAADGGSDWLKMPAPGTLQGEREVRIELLTSRLTPSERNAILGDLASGKIDIAVGTHALIQADVSFKSLGLVVIDEQQRFGVEQRAVLQERAEQASEAPDLLVMTGTPIPRTTAMTILGDLDLTELNELPAGRTPIATSRVLNAAQEADMWQQVREEIGQGHQVFVVCPVIHQQAEDQGKLKWEQNLDGLYHGPEPDVAAGVSADTGAGAASGTGGAADPPAKPLTGAIVAHRDLSAGELADCEVGLLHGQLKTAEKEAIMEDFRAGRLAALVSTTIVEVGVDVPNATVMVILDAQQFGLAQLHQLRGRVGRGGLASKCFLVGEATSDEGEQRLDALCASTDGFELARLDLEIRGEGTVMGERQSGRSSWKLARLVKDEELVLKIRDFTQDLVAQDPELKDHVSLWEEVQFMLRDEATEFLHKT